MSTNIVLPNLGFGMEEGRLLRWLKQPGEVVRKGDPIAEIESDKTNVELEATVDGVLAEVMFPADTVVSVGAVLARIETEAAPATIPAAPEPVAATTPAQPESARDSQRLTPLARKMLDAHGVSATEVKGTGWGGRITQDDIKGALASTPKSNGNGRPLAAPAVKKLARDKGIDLRMLSGSGTDGHITRADVEQAAHALAHAASLAAGHPQTQADFQSAASAAPVIAASSQPAMSSDEERTEVPFGKMRQMIAARLAQSMQDAPHFYVTAELDFTPVLRKLPANIGINTLLLYLTIQTLQSNLALNATFENGHVYQYKHVNLALAVALPDGLISPVLHHADDFSLAGLADRVRDLVNRARVGRLKPDELGGGTFTVSNLGMIKQVDRFTAILNPPQVGILAIGAAKERPFVIDGGLHIRTTAHLTLSADHRVVDGMVAAQFLEQFEAHLRAF